MPHSNQSVVFDDILKKTDQPGLVFVVDDEPMVTASLKALLSLETEHTVYAFNAPLEALKALDSLIPDVVISDFLMPDMDGIAFLTEVKRRFPETTVILLTGYADKENAIAAINQAGISRYLEKPWDNIALKQSISQGIERARLLTELQQTIFELHEAKQALQANNDNLELLVEQRTQELLVARDDFVSALTHDLRTPLLAAIQTLDMINQGQLGVLSDTQTTIFATMADSHQVMLALVNDLLDVYRYESGKGRLVITPATGVHVAELCEKVSQALAPLAAKKQHQVTLMLQPLPEELAKLSVSLDRKEFRRVLTNLLGNAIHYTPAGGNIQLRIALKGSQKESHMLEVRVTDNGRGIPAADIPLLFERFSQGTRQHRSSGTGLGLYLSKQIMQAHGGQIGVESQLDVGSQFWVMLPLEATTPA